MTAMDKIKWCCDKLTKILCITFIIQTCSVQAIEIKYTACDLFDQQQDSVIKLEITYSNKTYNTKELNFGFNIELAQSVMANGDYSAKNFIRLTSNLAPNALRYPGGTVANYFDWANEKLSEKQVVQFANKHINSLRKRLKRENNGRIPTADLASFSTLVSNQNIKPFVVLNVFDPDEKIFNAIDKVKSKIKKPVYWELGNEVAYKSYQKKGHQYDGEAWGKEAYRNKIIAISTYINSKYPLDKIGVVASEMAEWRNLKSKSTWRVELHRKSWDKVINSVNHLFDAVIVHPYVFAGEQFVSNVEVQCSKKNLPSYELKYRTWIVSNISSLPSLYLKRLSERYTGKNIWITEFGVMDSGGKNIDSKLQKQTGFRVLSTAANYISWLSKYPKISTFLTHGLFDGYDWAHVVFPDYSYTANGIAFKFVQEFLDDIDELTPALLSGHQAPQGVDSFNDMVMQSIYLIAGHNSQTGVRNIIIVNTGNHKANLKLPWHGGAIKSSVFRWDKKIKPGDYADLSGVNTHKIDLDEVVIPPMSINLLKSSHVPMMQ